MSTTATKRKRGVKLTPDQEARARAATIVNLRKKKAELEAALKAEEALLRQYVIDTGEVQIGKLTAYERLNPPKVLGSTGKTLEAHTSQLANQFPDYTQVKLDLSRMLAAWDTDVNLRNAFEARGLSIHRESNWYFKLTE